MESGLSQNLQLWSDKMKLQITAPGDSQIEGYKVVPFSGLAFPESLMNVSDNECEIILASNLIDACKLEQIGPTLQTLVGKLRLGGTLTVGGTDIRVFARLIVSGQLNENDGAKLIENRNSLTNSDTMTGTLNQLGLKIQSSIHSGAHYELTAIRS